MYRTILLALLLAVTLAACDTPAGSDDPGTQSSADIAVTKITDLPRRGGMHHVIALHSSGRMYSFQSSQIHVFDSPTSESHPLSSFEKYVGMAFAPDGAIWIVRSDAIHVYPPGSTTPNVLAVPVENLGSASLAWASDGTIYMAASVSARRALLKSTDNGSTWTTLTNPPRSGGSFAIGRGDELLLQTPQNLHVSTDGGTTWQTRAAAHPGYAGELLVARDGAIYNWVGRMGGLRVSRDGGASFTTLTPLNSAPHFLDVEQGGDGALYALVERSAEAAYLAGVYRSGDGGATWKLLLPVNGTGFAMHGSTIVVGAGATTDAPNAGIIVSQDNGATWQPYGTATVTSVSDAALDRDGNLLIIADGTLFRKKGADWHVVASQFAGMQRVAVTPQGTIGIALGTTFLRSTDNGASWLQSEITDFIVYKGALAVPALVGRSNGEFLLSMTSYENGIGHHAGSLYQIDASGTPKRIHDGKTYERLVQDRHGRIYGWRVEFNDDTYQFEYDRRTTVTGGTDWDEDPVGPNDYYPWLGFNSRNHYLRRIEKGLSVGEPGTTRESPERKLPGFTGNISFIKHALFMPDDRVYLVALNGLYYSNEPVR